MKVTRFWNILPFLFSFVLNLSAAAGDSPVLANLSLIVGHPEPERLEATGRLLESGIVIPLLSETGLRGGGSPGLRLPWDVPDKLKSTLRLESARIANAGLMALSLDQRHSMTLHGVKDEISVELEVLDASIATATFRVRFIAGDRELSKSNIVIDMGNRAVVGAPNSQDLPYLFLVLNPVGRSDLPEAGEKPILTEMVLPFYTPEAKAARLEGKVRIKGNIGKDGRLSGLDVVQTQSELLSQSALEALALWRYLPARAPSGGPLVVQKTWTISFVLE